MARSRKRTAPQEFGARRAALGLSQEALAERAGPHWTYLGGIERGTRNPTLAKIVLLAAALDVDPGELTRNLRP